MDAAVGARERDDLLCNRAPIEDVSTAVGDVFEGGGERRHPKDLAEARGAAIDGEGAERIRVLQHPETGDQLPLVRNDFGHREPLAGVLDRRCQHRGERCGAEATQGFAPRVHGPRDGHREHAGHRHGAVAALADEVDRERGRGAPAAIQSVQRAHGAVPDEHEAVAADAGHERLDDAEHRCRTHRRIDGVTAIT